VRGENGGGGGGKKKGKRVTGKWGEEGKTTGGNEKRTKKNPNKNG